MMEMLVTLLDGNASTSPAIQILVLKVKYFLSFN